MEYVKRNEVVECTDCGEVLPMGARYELKGEPDQVVCVACCHEGGMSISDPDEACECGAVDWSGTYEHHGQLYVDCEECGGSVCLNDPATSGLPNSEFKEQPGEDMELLRRLEAQHDWMHEPDEDDDRDYWEDEDDSEDEECGICGGVHGKEGGVCIDE